MPALVIAGAHRSPDLARLWYRSVARDVVPAFRRAGLTTEVVLFRDAAPEAFAPRWFEGAILESARPGARDFIEFYDALLSRENVDFILLLDADLFVLDGEWMAGHLALFQDPEVAAVSFLRRTREPGVYSLLFRRALYAALPPPVFSPSYEGLERWPNAVNLQPGDRAARSLRAAGKRIVDVPAAEAESRIADFHGTTVLRASREIFGGVLGDRFDRLLSEKPYFAMGAFDNILIGTLYRTLFGAPFAAGADGVHLSASATPETLRRALSALEDRTILARLVTYFERSERAIARLAAREGVPIHLPPVLPRKKRLEGRVWGALRRVLRRPGA